MQNEEAMQYSTIKKYEELQKSASFKTKLICIE